MAASVIKLQDPDNFEAYKATAESRRSIAIAALMIAAGIIILFNLNTSADWVMIVTGVMMIVSGALNVIGGALEFKRLR